MSHETKRVEFGQAKCDVCGDPGPEVRNPTPRTIENVTKAAGWWYRGTQVDDNFCVCPCCRSRMATASADAKHVAGCDGGVTTTAMHCPCTEVKS